MKERERENKKDPKSKLPSCGHLFVQILEYLSQKCQGNGIAYTRRCRSLYFQRISSLRAALLRENSYGLEKRWHAIVVLTTIDIHILVFDICYAQIHIRNQHFLESIFDISHKYINTDEAIHSEQSKRQKGCQSTQPKCFRQILHEPVINNQMNFIWLSIVINMPFWLSLAFKHHRTLSKRVLYSIN